ncbi:MAG: cytochrome c oxidase subunit 3 [Flavobacteriaceae bacterium]
MEVNNKSIYYPPGGILIWIVIYLELLTFGMAMLALAYYGSQDRLNYHTDSQLLNKTIATLNTVLLLTSGFLVAKGVHFFKNKLFQKTSNYFLWAMLSGLGFLLLKLVEYYEKLQAGLDMNYSTFYMFYWLLTGFHWIHVLVGLVILGFVRRSVLQKQKKAALEDIEAGAAFWHLCDLIWLLLFPILYLLF